MNEEELYKLALSNVPKYSLLNEILAIRDNRFPNEKVDYCINVNGYISLDVLNKYVRNINKLEQLQNNWNELKNHFRKQIVELEKVREDISADTYVDRKMFLKEVVSKMQELEGNNE